MGGKRFPSAADRFLSKTDRRGECWIWTGTKKPSGYGVFNMSTNRSMTAQRASYIFAFGAIPPGLQVCHRCDNPWCVNPKHLFLGTAKENMQDAVRKGRLSKPHERGWKVSAEQRRQIVALVNAGKSSRAIAADFGITHTAVLKIRRMFPDGVSSNPFTEAK